MHQRSPGSPLPNFRVRGERTVPTSLVAVGNDASASFDRDFSTQPNGVNPPLPSPTPASTKHYYIPCNRLFSSKAKNLLCCLDCAKGHSCYCCDSTVIDARPDQNLRYRYKNPSVSIRHPILCFGVRCA
ncbi:hypothetical protein FJTKL_08780 [Diaporthe vaccinii]|uniref:Uncharacterized protein n=1 Tax=Diaporthe vaccinii TaxID=105482 RepID=A0ABR4EQH3_9PEZI